MRSRWLTVGLVVSIALNLFLIGAGAGILGLGLRMARENVGARPAAFFWAAQGMAQPARRDTRRMLLDLRGEVRTDAERSRALRIQAWNGLVSATPDTAAIKQTLAQSRQIDAALRTRVEEAIVDNVARLALADRKAYAAGMSRELAAPAKR